MKKTKIAVTSRSFSSNDILRRELLDKYENVTFNDDGLKLETETLVNFLKGHEKAITALEIIDDELLSKLPKLKVISKYGVGVDMIDFDAMKRYGKRFGWCAGVNRRSVSEMVVSTAIAMLRHIPAAQREVLAGTWRQHKGGLLSDRIVGIIGCGNVGKDLVGLLKPFNCKIIAHDIADYTSFYKENNIESVELDSLLSRADVITIHVPLDSSTKDMLNADRLALIKKDSILINAARGGLVDEKALKVLLSKGEIAAAAFDVFAQEPPQDRELLELPNFLVTPHIGGSAKEAILAMGRAAIKGLDENEIP